ncbi:MAG: hypothetical protein J5737_01085 [Bacteroidales bacterium]|nr:hypothetical protein [Bacteroidales bacterium]
MRKKLYLLLVLSFLIPFVSCKPEVLPDPEDPEVTDPEDPEDPEDPDIPEEPEYPFDDPSKEPAWPGDSNWPSDEDAFDYDILESRQAHLPAADSPDPFPKTYDKVFYGSAMSLGTGGDKFVLQRAASENYTAAVNSGRFMSITITRPGTLSFIPRIVSTDPDKIPTLLVALVTTKDGEVVSAKNIYKQRMTNWTTSGNYNVLKDYRIYVPVSEQDLAGITEPATLYVYCTVSQMIIYPLKWIAKHYNYDYDVDGAANSMKAKVLESPNTVNPGTVAGNCYFVSNDGDDGNDGLSEATPIKTISKVNSLALKPGDAVLFRRGDTWRRNPARIDWEYMIPTKPGVTYSSYGSGEKPRILGSPWNAAEEGVWTPSDKNNVYVYDASFGKCAVGGMLLDGKLCPLVNPSYGLSDLTHSCLTKDGTCFQEGSKLYICSTGGNPSERWSDIEIFVAGHIFRPMGDCVIDNLCIRYCGSHGIGTGVNLNLNLAVTNCEISWIGGAFNHAGKSDQVRYGNGIQLWGGCESFVVENCWIYQCFDTGITHQYTPNNNDDCIMANIRYSGNLIEECYYSIEWFLDQLDGHERIMKNVLIDRNICRNAGYGWGNTRSSNDEHLMRHIQSWTCTNPAENFVISNNIFDRSTWPDEMFTVYAKKAAWQPEPHNNFCVK